MNTPELNSTLVLLVTSAVLGLIHSLSNSDLISHFTNVFVNHFYFSVFQESYYHYQVVITDFLSMLFLYNFPKGFS